MPSTSALSLRISETDRQLIDKAAEAQNKTRTEFMLDSARTATTDALLDRRLFVLDGVEFKAFGKALAQAPRASDVIRKLKQRPLPWKS